MSERLSEIQSIDAKLTHVQFKSLEQLGVLIDEFYNNDLNVE